MPILSGTVTFASYRVEHTDTPPADLRRWLSRGLRARGFKPIDKAGEEERSSGFVELADRESAEFAYEHLFEGDHALMAWRIDTLKISMRDVKTELAAWADSFEVEQKRVPTKSEKAARRTALRQTMRSRAVPVTKVFDASWNLHEQTLLIWTASRKILDQIIEALESTLHIRLHAATPSAAARRRGVADEILGPTPELVGIELSGEAAASFDPGRARDRAEVVGKEVLHVEA